MSEPNDLMPPDDRDPWQEMSENERAEYEAWSKMVDEKNGVFSGTPIGGSAGKQGYKP